MGMASKLTQKCNRKTAKTDSVRRRCCVRSRSFVDFLC